jgi:hypothetical protein
LLGAQPLVTPGHSGSFQDSPGPWCGEPGRTLPPPGRSLPPDIAPRGRRSGPGGAAGAA